MGRGRGKEICGSMVHSVFAAPIFGPDARLGPPLRSLVGVTGMIFESVQTV
jgi:hypothetical protein